MSKSKYSEALQDAYMLGDMNKVAELKDLISEEYKERYAAEFPKEAARLTQDNVIKINTVMNDDDTSAKGIYDYMNKSIGEDWWEDEIETIDRVLWMKYGTVLSEINKDKMLAVRHLCRTANAFDDWYEFNQLALSFGGAIADFAVLKSPTPGMVINAINTMNYIRPDVKSDFSDEVISYICIVLINNGIYVPPVSIAELISKKMNELTKYPSSKWKGIESKFVNVIKGKDVNIDDESGIQAKRLVIAEAAASEYFRK